MYSILQVLSGLSKYFNILSSRFQNGIVEKTRIKQHKFFYLYVRARAGIKISTYAKGNLLSCLQCSA
jgi:hypothetical protein